MDITLGEALNLRSDLQTNIDEMKRRVLDNIKIQEGDDASLDPNIIKQELFKKIDNLTSLILRINKTNNLTMFNDELSLADALSLRDSYLKKRAVLNSMMEAASMKENRYSMSEIRFINLVDLNDLQSEINHISKEWRKLDTEIQKLNWNTYLL